MNQSQCQNDGDIDATALAVATLAQIPNLRIIAVLTDNNGVPVSSLGINVSDLETVLNTGIVSEGEPIGSLPAAAVPSATDTFFTLQSGNGALQSLSQIASFILNQVNALRAPVIELTQNTQLDGSVHNSAILICSEPVVVSPAASFSSLGSGFHCTIVNLSNGAVTFGSGILTSSGGEYLPSGQQADVSAFNYSAGNIVYAKISGNSVVGNGVSVATNQINYQEGQNILVTGTINPQGTPVQIALGNSSTTAPTSGWVASTVTGTSFSGSIVAATTGNQYVWAQETGNPVIVAVSNEIIVSSETLSISTQPPQYAAVGGGVPISGTVGTSGQAVQVGFSTSTTTPPTTWSNATTTGTSWSASPSETTAADDYYIWVRLTATPSVYVVSTAVTVGLIVIIQPSNQSVGVPFQLAGYPLPADLPVQAVLSQSAVTFPTSGWVNMSELDGIFFGNLTAPSAGTWYAWASVQGAEALSFGPAAVSGAFTVS